ncbi:hypothetical protein K7X08_001272 [Anisodus acutangulus]|uniref:Glycosyltransferase N-terminal domain-containing protein n=1 Tax=Anisodus acutangulus TaxID=402998 RepID=A0A9Q1MND7_9SOLA|nr:hypothetical protein K7X08_001272 [Anisodus acutangulus]
MSTLVKKMCLFLIFANILGLVIFGSCVEGKVLEDSHHHQCNHGHEGHHHHGLSEVKERKLLEELAEEEDLKLYGFGSRDNMDEHHHHDGHGAKDLTGLGLWVNAMGCSLLVSLASLICLILLPIIFIQGKPSKAVVDSLALFGAGAMLGDAFLHQLPHAFGGGHSHSHDHHVEHDHLHDHSGHSHAHSLEDLSVGLSILAGIVLFLIVEKLVRYVEEFSGGVDEWSHGHHHRHTHITKLKDDNDANGNLKELSQEKSGSLSDKTAGGSGVDGESADSPSGGKPSGGAILRKRNTGSVAAEDNTALDAANCSTNSGSIGDEQAKPRSSLVFGYLNLFSDGVHNFTDGMALGSAFLLYGSVGGWSRTLFLLAHELPQEIGDFGILVRSGFSVSKALFFNFLSALVALAGTALSLTLGQDSGHSSLIEGFTAGGFMYISVAGVLAEMNNSGRTTMFVPCIMLSPIYLTVFLCSLCIVVSYAYLKECLFHLMKIYLKGYPHLKLMHQKRYKLVTFQLQYRDIRAGDLYNSKKVLEGTSLDLMAEYASTQNKKQWAIGPILPTKLDNVSNKRNKCLDWLDNQPPRSVLYVSFGSSTTFSDKEIMELAMGLERSKQKFVWVLRDADRGDIFTGEARRFELPEGFEERVKRIGLVVREWAPKLEILAHSSTGGFISHCGWNSCTESITMGVPIAAWPMHSEQPINAFFVTEMLKIGLIVREWEKREELVNASTIENFVRKLMVSEEGDEIRKRAEELGAAVRQSTEKGGASQLELDSFIAHITR